MMLVCKHILTHIGNCKRIPFRQCRNLALRDIDYCYRHKDLHMLVKGWDAVEDMRRNTTARYKYIDVYCKMENDQLYACHELDYQDENPPWYLWTTGLNDNKWEKIK